MRKELIIMKNTELEKLVYEPKDIMHMLGISRGLCYDFLNKVYRDKGPFKVIKINTSIRVPRKEFDLWLSQAC